MFLPVKYEKYTSENTKLNAWVKFIRKPEDISMEDVNNNEALKKAKEVLDEISGDKREEELAFQRLIPFAFLYLFELYYLFLL